MPDVTGGSIRWSAYEHEHIERENDWYIALGIIAVCAALTSILFSDVLFALVIILAAVVIGMMARRPPSLHNFELSNRGIKVGDVMHSFDEIISFWVHDDEKRPMLFIDTTKFMSPNLIIPIEDVRPSEVRAFLSEYAEEVQMEEPLPHKILEFFGL